MISLFVLLLLAGIVWGAVATAVYTFLSFPQ